MTYTVTVVDDGTTTVVTANTGLSSAVVTATSVGPIGPPSPLRLMPFVSGPAGPSEELFRLVAPETYTLDETRCAATSRVASTTNATFTLYCEDVAIATYTFVAGSNNANVIISNTSISEGNIVKFVSPVAQDDTLSDIGFVFYASVAN